MESAAAICDFSFLNIYKKLWLKKKNNRERRKLRTEKRERDVGDISVEEIRNMLRKMKKRKAQGPDGIPVEV